MASAKYAVVRLVKWLNSLGVLEACHVVVVAQLRILAEAVDADPTNAALHREFGKVEGLVRGLAVSGDVLDDLIAEINERAGGAEVGDESKS